MLPSAMADTLSTQMSLKKQAPAGSKDDMDASNEEILAPIVNKFGN
jgi:hypothetical protein